MARNDGDKGEMETGRFSLEEYRKDASRIVAHAETHGRAVVVDDEGRERVRISIPTTALPVFEPEDK